MEVTRALDVSNGVYYKALGAPREVQILFYSEKFNLPYLLKLILKIQLIFMMVAINYGITTHHFHVILNVVCSE